ncbi:MAG: hypothetical protein RR594_06695 [Clostridia bacterium]
MKLNKIKRFPFNFKTVVTLLLIILSFVCGIIMLLFGMKGTNELDRKTENYQETNGYFSSYSIYSSDKDKTTYRLVYTYIVNGENYMVSTDYGTQFIPKENNIEKIKYNPEYPEQSIIVGTNTNNSLIFIGIIFITVPIVIFLGMLSIIGYFKKVKIDIIGIIIGITFITVGFGAIYMLTGSFSILEIFKTYSIIYILPSLIIFLIIGTGIYLLIKCLFFNRRKK